MAVVSTAAPRCTASGCNLIHTSDTEESQLGFASFLLGGGNESKNIPHTALHGCGGLLSGRFVKRAWSHVCLFASPMMREMAVQSLWWWWWSVQEIHSWNHCAENQWQKCFEVCCGNMLEQNVQSDFSETDATLLCVINTFLLLLHWNITGDLCLRLLTLALINNKNGLWPQNITTIPTPIHDSYS